MSGSESSVWTRPDDNGYAEPRSAPRRAHGSHKTLRITFFAVAAAWGFLMGLGTLVIMLTLNGQNSSPSNPALLWLLGPGVIAAVLGGLAAASAYREARRRHAR